MKRTITCYCGETIETDIGESFDASKEPSVIREILDGTFMNITCEKCGKVLKPEFPFTLVYDSGHPELTFIPELGRVAFLAGKTAVPENSRVVIGYPELVEKVRIFRDGLDERFVEAIKLRMLEKAGDDQQDVRIFYVGSESGTLSFHVHGLRENQVGITRVPAAIYEKIGPEIDELSSDEDYAPIFTPPYISVTKVYLED